MTRPNGMSRRSFLGGLGAAVAAAILPFACGGKDDAAEAGSADPRVFTRADPGRWRGKEDAHEPQAAFTKLDESGNFRVDVVVNHGMSPAHWISSISVKDQDDRLLGERQLAGTDPKAEATFQVSMTGVTSLGVYETCNLHGLWLNTYAAPA